MGCFIGKTKTENRQNKITNSFTTLHVQASVQPYLGRQAFKQPQQSQLGREMPQLRTYLLPPSAQILLLSMACSSQFSLLNMMTCAMEYYFLLAPISCPSCVHSLQESHGPVGVDPEELGEILGLLMSRACTEKGLE